MVSTVIPVQPFDLVIFGATGDLAHRKILPSLYRRLSVHQMPQEARIIGAVQADAKGRLLLQNAYGSRRIVDMLMGEILPRIC